MKYLIALLAAVTGILHVLIGFGVIAAGIAPTNWMLVLNGVGYLVLLVLFWRASGNGGIIRWILLVYTLITLVSYFIIGAGFAGGTTPLFTKAIELLLAILLLLHRGPRVAVTVPAPAARAAAPGASATTAVTSTADVPDVASRSGGAPIDISAAATDVAADITEASEEAGDVVADVADTVVEAAEDAYDVAAEVAGDVADAAGDAAGTVVDAVADVAESASDVVDAAIEEAGSVIDDVTGAIDDAADAAVDAVRGGAAVVAADVDEIVETAEEKITTASAGSADDDADEASGSGEEDLIAELREYFRNLESNSEYSKPVEYIEGIGAVYGQKLRAINVNTVLDLLLSGATRRGRKNLSDQSGISPSLILTWVNHADLFRIKGVGQEYADLLEEAGVDTVIELAQRNPANLHKRMIEVNDQKALVRRTPYASEVESWVEQAKQMRRAIYY